MAQSLIYRVGGQRMRFVLLFLVGYCLPALGVGLVLWQTGLLGRVAPVWVGAGALAVVGVGIGLSVLSEKPIVGEEARTRR